MKYGYSLFSAWAATKDKESFIDILRQLKEIGYDGVEFFNYLDIPGEEMRKIIEEIGLEPFSTHPRLFRFFDNLDEEIAYAKKASIGTLVMPYIDTQDRTAAYYQKLLDSIPVWKKACDNAGLKLAWHNHDFEFQPYGNYPYLMDAILEKNPEIGFEIDTCWTSIVGLDTAAYMEKYAGRISMVHFKDYRGIGTQDSPDEIDFCALGEGRVDIQAVADKAGELRVDWAIVEQDRHNRDILEDAKISLAKLKECFASK